MVPVTCVTRFASVRVVANATTATAPSMLPTINVVPCSTSPADTCSKKKKRLGNSSFFASANVPSRRPSRISGCRRRKSHQTYSADNTSGASCTAATSCGPPPSVTTTPVPAKPAARCTLPTITPR